MRITALVLAIGALAPLLAAPAPGPFHTIPPIDEDDAVAAWLAHETGGNPVDETDVPATPVDGVFRVHVLLDTRSWSQKADPIAWTHTRFAQVAKWFESDHGVRLVLCRVGVFDVQGDREFSDIVSHAVEADSAYAQGLRMHTGLPVADAANGDCAGPSTALGEAPAPDLMAVLVAGPLTCGGAPVGGCASLLGSFSMTRDYSGSGTPWGNHVVEHILQHEISHNFGATDNECTYGIMDYDHTLTSHDWCTRDEARMTGGKHLVRANWRSWAVYVASGGG